MGYANQEIQTYGNAVPLAATTNLAAIESRNNDTLYLGIVWTGATNNSAVVKLQESGDGTNWKDLAGKTATLSAASGIANIKMQNQELVAPVIRAVVTPNGETTGTATISFFLKGHK